MLQWIRKHRKALAGISVGEELFLQPFHLLHIR